MIAAIQHTSEPASVARVRRVNIMQGEQHVASDPTTMIATLLGSCVAACLYDPVEGVGGMNHFLLPGRRVGDAEGVRFGVHAMELLVNALLNAGASRERLRAKLFGGAQMIGGMADLGRQNADFALAFLRAEGVEHVGGSVGGAAARRVQFWPASGRARQRLAAGPEAAVFSQEIRSVPVLHDIVRDCGAVELF